MPKASDVEIARVIRECRTDLETCCKSMTAEEAGTVMLNLVSMRFGKLLSEKGEPLYWPEWQKACRMKQVKFK